MNILKKNGNKIRRNMENFKNIGNLNFNFIELNSKKSKDFDEILSSAFMNCILYEIMNTNNIELFSKFIKIDENKNDLYPHQNNILKLMNENSSNSFLNIWSRRQGYSTMLAIYLLYQALINKEQMLIFVSSISNADYLNDKINYIYNNLPENFKDLGVPHKYTQKDIYFSNNSKICFKSFSHYYDQNMDNLRGRYFDKIIFLDLEPMINNVFFKFMDDLISLSSSNVFKQLIINSDSTIPLKFLIKYNNFIKTIVY